MSLLERVDPELRAHLESLPPMNQDIPIAKRREAMRKLQEPLLAQLPATPEVATADVDVPGGPRVRVYKRHDHVPATAAMLWIHGGGMCFGSVEGDDFMCRTWARKLGCVVASVEYRLAPEHPYPAAVDDCYAALRWLSASVGDLGVDPSRLVIGGASAGGGLAAGTALLARDRGEVDLAFQFLVFPMIDDRHVTPSSREIDLAGVWNHEANVHAWRAYLGDRAGTETVPLYAAPARASVEDLRGLPPAYIDVGELDPFRDEDIGYAQRLLQAGVPCELHVTPGVFHGSEGQVLQAASSRRIRGYRTDALQRILA